MGDERASALLVSRSRDKDEEHCRVTTPDLVALDEQVEKQRPVLRVAVCVENSTGVRVAGGRRPARRLEEDIELGLRNRLARHRPRRPSIEEQRLDRMVGLTMVATANGHESTHAQKERER